MRIPAPIFVLIGVIMLSMCACNKYDEGPAFSIRTKTFRATDNWKIGKAFKDGVDVTTGTRMSIDLKSDGSLHYTDTTVIASGDSISNQVGVWEFDHEAENLLLVFTNPGGGAISAKVWYILRLTVGELWVTETVGESLYRYEFEPK